MQQKNENGFDNVKKIYTLTIWQEYHAPLAVHGNFWFW